ncbi:choice-of-anchor A family protein [Edaphobacter aggregans]|uniref:choice-of-anchor A family protein n=1 Tax=Edaphobacter aggregans TaxID=570835 RepID=UPI0012FC84AA|nr:choice-of-anchor A family protein [Edaphobacter aggregans]
MKLRPLVLSLAALAALPSVCKADGVAPFGVASAYNLVALGTVDSHGNTLIAGNISTSADVTGRVAAAGMVLSGTTIGSSLNADPWGSLASNDLVSTGGLNSGEQFNINSHGNAYAPGANGSFNFNGGGHRVTSGSSGIDFNTLRTTLDAQSLALAALTAIGDVLGTNQPGVNPSFFVLKGTSSILNVFTITAAEFADTNHPIDIQAPAGSTIIINVTGTHLTLGTGIYYNQSQNSGDSSLSDNILFNFADAQTVAINGQFNASLLAPFAMLTGSAQMGGNFIAAAIGQTGEVHNDEFTGTLPPTTSQAPEPGSLALMGTGMTALAGTIRRRAKR